MGIQTKRWLIAMRIFSLSLRIRRNRAMISRLIKAGAPYTSPKLVKLNTATVHLGYRTHRLLTAWENAGPRAAVSRFPTCQPAQEERSA